MLTLTAKIGEEIRITHGGEDLYIILSKVNGHIRLGFLGPKTFGIKRLKGDDSSGRDSRSKE